VKAFKAHDLTNTAWAYTTAKDSSPVLFQKLSEAALKKRNKINSKNTANFLWAVTTNGHIELDGTYLNATAKILPLHVVDVQSQSLLNHDFENACLEKETKFNLEDLCPLYQWNLQLECKSDIQLPPSLLKKHHDAFVSKDPAPSAL
ncbi:hypothetical protein ACHAWF_000860, partial [Thalassiosira exigua]